jgi:hypothetical protein
MLDDEQIERIRSFFASPTGIVLFEQLKASVIAEWMCSEPPELQLREDSFHTLQAILRLEAMLRDAPAMKRMTQRVQERRDLRN